MSSSNLIPNVTRIRDVDGFCGTVVYVGPVASAKNSNEVYAGICWDDPSRGKHDGSVIDRRTNKLLRHFACGPTQGSFLRLNKVDTGLRLTPDLLRDKYVEMQAPLLAPNNLLPHTARTSSGRDDKPIEFLGELQIRQYQQLQDLSKVSLRRQGISSVAEEGMSEFANIRDMDLAGNLLSSWEVVIAILKRFPTLECLNLTGNRIQNLDDLQVRNQWRLKVLNLNSCGITSFATIQWIAQSMPQLEELCVAYSEISDMDKYNIPHNTFQQLKVLDCSSCNLSSWETQVAKLGTLPQLESLSLDDNPLTRTVVQPSSFQLLQSLQLAGTAVSAWYDLNGINALPSLTMLRLKNTPLTSTMGQGEVRAIAIARFPSLKYLNASVVSTKERVEAERRYVSLVTRLLASREATEPSDSNDDTWLQQEHPQFSKLREIHKDMVIAHHSSSGAGGVDLAASVCNVTIASMSPSSCDMEPLHRRLPGTLQVGRLKALCARAFGLDVDLMTLHFRTESDAFPTELDDDNNTLDYYGVSDGAEILMNEIDLAEKEKESSRLTEERDRKMAEQERDLCALQELQRRHNGGVRQADMLGK